jgi:hypothetical protein
MKHRGLFFTVGGVVVVGLLSLAHLTQAKAATNIFASELSYIASVATFFYVILLFICLIDEFLFDEFEFWERISEDPIAVAIVFLALCILGHASITKAQPHMELAQTYVGITEATGKNDGEVIERMLLRYGGEKGMNYCSAFVGEVLDSVGAREPKRLGKRTLLARSWVRGNSIRARDVLLGRAVVSNGAIVIWEKGETIWGHCGFVKSWRDASGETIEANTTNGDGNQRNGDGIYERARRIVPTAYFRIVWFTPVLNKD